MQIYFAFCRQSGLFGGFPGPEGEEAEAGKGNEGRDEVAQPTPFSRQVQPFGCNKDITAAYHGHKGGGEEGY